MQFLDYSAKEKHLFFFFCKYFRSLLEMEFSPFPVPQVHGMVTADLLVCRWSG